MSGFEGPVLKGMNPFSNNQPRLTASERIRNKRDATIYQAEKQRFQNKKMCGNKNVKYYDNGTIRSIKSYKLQKSLARGNVLCEDCDDKGSLCKGPSSKDELNSIQMGNNVVSEYWGGSSFQGDFTQLETYPVIQSDISGVWGLASPPEISKADLSGGTMLPGSDPSLNMPFGYIKNLIKIPRNLDGSGIVIDPSNILFPDELCDPFRYLKHSYLKTYLVLTMAVPVTSSSHSPSDRNQPSSCNDPSYNLVVGNYFILQGSPGGGIATVVNGVVKSLCCIGTLQLDVPYINPADATVTDPGIFGLFKVYVNLANIGNFDLMSMLLNTKPSIDNNNLSEWPLPNISDWSIGFSRPQSSGPNLNYYINFVFIRNVDIIQGTIPPSLNQTKYNATKQSYMSCLENSTRKINFTKNTVKQDNVIAAYCTPCAPTTPPHTITVVGGTADTSSVPGYTIYTFGLFLPTSLTIDISGGFYCGGTVSLEYLVVGGGGGGGSPLAGNAVNASVGGGGGGGKVETGTIVPPLGTSTTFTIIVGAGGPGGIDTSVTFDISGTAGVDGSGSTLASPFMTTVEADGGQGAPVMVASPSDFTILGQICSNGGDSGTGYTGGDCSYNNVQIGGGGGLGYLAPVVGGGGGGASENGQPGFFPPGSLDPNNGTGDASGGRGGSGVLSSISGTSTWYGPGGGGAAIAFNWTGFSFLDASGIGGSSGVVGAGGHGGPVDISGAPGPHGGAVATLFGGGGGGSSSANPDPKFPPDSLSPPAAGIVAGDGRRGIVIIRVKNST